MVAFDAPFSLPAPLGGSRPSLFGTLASQLSWGDATHAGRAAVHCEAEARVRWAEVNSKYSDDRNHFMKRGRGCKTWAVSCCITWSRSCTQKRQEYNIFDFFQIYGSVMRVGDAVMIQCRGQPKRSRDPIPFSRWRSAPRLVDTRLYYLPVMNLSVT